MLVKKQSAAIAVTAIRALRGTPEAERRTKKRGGLTLRCENIEHARCGIQPGIARGQNGCEHDGVHDGGSGQEARALKHKRKGLTLMSVSSFLSSRGSVYGMMRLITRMERI